MKKKKLRIFLFAFAIVGLACVPQKKNLRLLTLGDSYTICTGASEKESWPVLLTEDLKKEGVDIELVTNPARNGFTTQDLIDRELPVLKSSKPDAVTLLIGVNDWVQGRSEAAFKKDLQFILDEVQALMTNQKNILVLTIPDFSLTPQGKKYSNGRNITEGIKAFNAIISEESARRGLPLVDLFEPSLKMAEDPTLIASDGLHPSAKMYAEWEKLILSEMRKMLENT
jgi:lysophospholipase L1-like esterase